MVLLLYLIVLATSSFATPATGDGETSPEIELEPFPICNATNPWHYYLPNSSFEANLAKISAAFPSVASANGGFAKGPVGAAPDTVYGLALCRGDTEGDSCRTCIEKAFQDAQSSCGYGKDVAVYHDRCHVRISDSDFLAPNTNEPTRDMWNPSNITEPSTFLGLEWDAEEDSESVALVIGGLVSAFLRETAKFAADNTPGRFATAAMDIGGLELYSMAQCTPDLLTPVCVQCLEDIIIRGTPASFKTRQGRRFLGVRCSFRYESYSFYEGKPMANCLTGRRLQLRDFAQIQVKVS
nr:unnamed protein product [Digitaria exilis]